MSGHSKWHSIRHKKGAADAKRSAAFTKLAKAIVVAAREGGADLDSNFSLRLAVDKAKRGNMPKDRIQRAVDRGAGVGGDGVVLETAIYEAMGPGGVAILIEAFTDNKNRTVSNVKTICNRKGGNLGAKVAWMFDRKGVVRVDDVSTLSGLDELELSLIDVGAGEVVFSEGGLYVECEVQDLQGVQKVAHDAGLVVSAGGIAYVANQTTSLDDDQLEKLGSLMDALEEDDDVNSVYTNVG